MDEAQCDRCGEYGELNSWNLNYEVLVKMCKSCCNKYMLYSLKRPMSAEYGEVTSRIKLLMRRQQATATDLWPELKPLLAQERELEWKLHLNSLEWMKA